MDADTIFEWPQVPNWWDDPVIARSVNDNNLAILKRALETTNSIYLYADDFGGRVRADAVVIIPEEVHKLRLETVRVDQAGVDQWESIRELRGDLEQRYPSHVSSFEDALVLVEVPTPNIMVRHHSDRTGITRRHKLRFTWVVVLAIINLIACSAYFASPGSVVVVSGSEETATSRPSIIISTLRFILGYMVQLFEWELEYALEFWKDTLLILVFFCSFVYAIYRWRRYIWFFHDIELAEDIHADVNTPYDTVEREDEFVLKVDRVASAKYAKRAAMVIKSTKGLLTKTAANDLMITRLASDYLLKEVGMRPHHVACTLPLVHPIVYLPTDNDILAQKISASNAFAQQRADYTNATNPKWLPWFHNVGSYRYVGSTPTST